MSNKRIESWKAKRIGQAVARKAFAHVTDPLEETLRAALEAAYWQEMTDCGITRKAHDALKERRAYRYQRCELRWLKDDVNFSLAVYPQGYEHNGFGDNTSLPHPFLFDSLQVQNTAAPASIEAAMAALDPWRKKVAAMADEVAAQITDRTVNLVRKTWPEITPFVCEVMGIKALSNTPPAPVPFEELLNKHLLALPAPAPVPKPTKRASRK